MFRIEAPPVLQMQITAILEEYNIDYEVTMQCNAVSYEYNYYVFVMIIIGLLKWLRAAS